MNFDDFTPQNVVAAATEYTGLSTFRHMRFMAGLEQMIAAVRDEGALNDAGAAGLFERFVGMVVNRLLADRLFTEKPEILDQPLGQLTVIIGLPRTGTTKLQRALSRHPDLNFLKGWEVVMPVPLSGDKATSDDPRRAMVGESLKMRDEALPDFKAIHEMVADEAEEDALLMLHSFTNDGLFDVRIPSYTAWLQQQDVTWTYEELLDYLKLLQWQNNQVGRPWVLKNVLHIAHLDTLFEVIPTAKLVWAHRDPAQAIGSWCSMISTGREQLSDRVDRRQVGPEQMGYWRWAVEAGMSHRDASPQVELMDVQYRDVVTDFPKVLDDILAFASLDRSDGVLGRLLEWEQDNPQGKHGEHRYALDDFGLSKNDIHGQFGPYTQRFGLALP